MDTLGILTDAQARFYTCCLVLILEHFFLKRVVYRDLKPESIHIDEQGYPKLQDFATAKIVRDRTAT
jgi:serine/threonine protein kinase